MSSYSNFYNRINWVNNTTPINETNLNKLDYAAKKLDDRTVELSLSKIEPEYVSNAITNIEFDDTTGVFTFTKLSGATVTLDTTLEQVITNFTYDADRQCLVLEYPDGSTADVDLSAFITETEYEDTSTIAFTIANHKVKAVVKEHSINSSHLTTDYLSQITTQANRSKDYAEFSMSYALGEGNKRTGEATDNAKYYKEQAEILKNYTEDAVGVSGFDIDSNGNLVYTNNAVYSFTVDDNGFLNYEVQV